MKLTREMKEIRERAFSIGGNYLDDVDKLLSMLEKEMDKPGVWDDAPDDCTECTVNFVKHERVVKSSAYTRTLPKSRIDEIAEECVKSVFENKAPTVEVFKDAIKSAILKDREEREAGR